MPNTEIMIDGKVFHKSALCHTDNCCVAVRKENDKVFIADTKNPDQKPLEFDNDEFSKFKQAILNNEF